MRVLAGDDLTYDFWPPIRYFRHGVGAVTGSKLQQEETAAPDRGATSPDINCSVARPDSGRRSASGASPANSGSGGYGTAKDETPGTSSHQFTKSITPACKYTEQHAEQCPEQYHRGQSPAGESGSGDPGPDLIPRSLKPPAKRRRARNRPRSDCSTKPRRTSRD